TSVAVPKRRRVVWAATGLAVGIGAVAIGLPRLGALPPLRLPHLGRLERRAATATAPEAAAPMEDLPVTEAQPEVATEPPADAPVQVVAVPPPADTPPAAGDGAAGPPEEAADAAATPEPAAAVTPPSAAEPTPPP